MVSIKCAKSSSGVPLGMYIIDHQILNNTSVLLDVLIEV